jgi:hypothetical protein
LDEMPNEPAIKDRVTLETRDGGRILGVDATVANLTREEVWVALGRPSEHVLEGKAVRIIQLKLDREVAADTSVKRMIGPTGRMAALWRPANWSIEPRRANSRLPLAIPGYLRPTSDGVVVPVRTTNISVGGFHCVTDFPLSVGHEMAASLMLTPRDSFDCHAQVVRISDDPDDPSHTQLLVAFRFVDLSVADDVRIAAALAGLGEETDPNAVPEAWHGPQATGRLPR